MLRANPFVYEKSYEADIKGPDISAMLEEQYGQCAEDLLVLSFIRGFLQQEHGIDLKNKVCVEIGANHAFAGSNSFLLSKMLGLTSLLVEANPALIPDLKKARPDSEIHNLAIIDSDLKEVEFFVSKHSELSSLDRNFIEQWHEGNIGIETTFVVAAQRFNNFFADNLRNREILFLSIDVEGCDLKLLRDLNFNQWRPVLLQVEPSEHYIPDESTRIMELMRENNYRLIFKTNVNLVFCDAVYFKDFSDKHDYSNIFDKQAEQITTLTRACDKQLNEISTHARTIDIQANEISTLANTLKYAEENLKQRNDELALIKLSRAYKWSKFLADKIKQFFRN